MRTRPQWREREKYGKSENTLFRTVKGRNLKFLGMQDMVLGTIEVLK